MKIALGADHYGFPLKEQLIEWLKANGHTCFDLGTHRPQERDELICDYTDAVCIAVSNGQAERGLLVCQSGGFMNIRANKWPKIRGAMAFNPEVVAHDRAASDINMLAFPGHFITKEDAITCLETFINTPFEALERRVMRLNKLQTPPPIIV